MPRTIILAACLALASLGAQAEVRFASSQVVVVDDDTGEILLQKRGDSVAPIASMTKLLTAMVVIDAQQDAGEPIEITDADLDRLKNTRSGVPVGSVLSRQNLLELALIASDNRAASALARNYPGGTAAFDDAVRGKIATLGLEHTEIEEPTGLSPNNRASAHDMVKVLRAAAGYPEIAELTSRPRHAVEVGGRRWAVRNTNPLVGAPGWEVLLSKTGFTSEAGRCVGMRIQAAGRTVMIVLMGARGPRERAHDAHNIRRWLAGEPPIDVKVKKRKAAAKRRVVAAH